MPIYEKKSSDPNDISKNPVLHDFISKENEREGLYREKIIEITNKGAFYRLDKCCETINIILNKESLNYYFNINDLNAIIDILLREAQSVFSSETRAQIFRLIETIIQNKTYMEHKEKIDEVKQMVNEVVKSSEDDIESKSYEKAELAAIASLDNVLKTYN